MNRNRLWSRAIGFVGLMIFTSGPMISARCQEASSPPKVPVDSSKTPQAPPNVKSWYPRLSGLSPMKAAADAIFSLGGQEYKTDSVLAAFFPDVSQTRTKEILGIFALSEVDESSDGRSYTLTLTNPYDLFAVLDKLNDLSEVQLASLVQAQQSSVVPSSPLDHPSGAGGYSGESLLPGDVDGNSMWTASDAIHILRANLGLEQLAPLAQARADVNRNGQIDLSDAVLTLGLVVGRSLPPPYGYPG